MRFSRTFVLPYLLGWLVAQPVLAEMDPAEYELKASVRSEKERQRLQAEFEADKQREADRQRMEEEGETRRLAAEKAAWEALPYPARLTRTRCTACHAADNFENRRHNRIGWELAVLRMQILNEAPIGAGERSVIAAQLAEAYPASGSTAWVEALQQLAVALLPVCFWLVWKIARSRHGGRK